MFKSEFPRDFEKRQNEIPNKNTIGSISEILQLPRYQRLRKINKTATITLAETRKHGFYCETTKILANLQLSLKLRNLVIINAEKFYPLLKKGTKYRSERVLIPVSIYITCLEHFIFVKRYNFYNYCSKNDFNRCLKAILRENASLRMKLHSKDFRIKSILIQLNGLRNHFSLSESFFTIASKNLYNYYDVMKNTKITVITGRIFDMTKNHLNDKLMPACKICNFLGIRQSTMSLSSFRNVKIFSIKFKKKIKKTINNKQSEVNKTMLCEQCYKKIKKIASDKKHIHINVQQNPQQHHFCSRECKIQWMYYVISHKKQKVLEAFV